MSYYPLYNNNNTRIHLELFWSNIIGINPYGLIA